LDVVAVVVVVVIVDFVGLHRAVVVVVSCWLFNLN